MPPLVGGMRYDQLKRGSKQQATSTSVIAPPVGQFWEKSGKHMRENFRGKLLESKPSTVIRTYIGGLTACQVLEKRLCAHCLFVHTSRRPNQSLVTKKNKKYEVTFPLFSYTSESARYNNFILSNKVVSSAILHFTFLRANQYHSPPKNKHRLCINIQSKRLLYLGTWW